MRSLFLCWLLVGCTGIRGPEGPEGPPGPAGPAGKDSASSAISCKPGEAFCDGDKVWSCTKSGRDAALITDCAGGSASNPTTCATTDCPYGWHNGACCRNKNPTCAWSFTAPSTLAATLYGYSDQNGNSCTSPAPAPSACAANDIFSAGLSHQETSGCPATTAWTYITFAIDRGQAAPGMITLPASGVTVEYDDSTQHCKSWTGTVDWVSDVPSYKIVFSITCSETGKSGLALSGTIDGNV